MRKTYYLNSSEINRFYRLRPVQGEAWDFWKTVALVRGLDYKSIIGDTENKHKFTALAMNHKKQWCYPWALKCSQPPIEL